MLNARLAFAGSKFQGEELPYVPELKEMYRAGIKLRLNQLMMLAGQPGSQKSGFIMWLCDRLGLPCLYVSGDMSKYTAATRLVAIRTGLTSDQVEEKIEAGEDDFLAEALADSRIEFLFSSEPSLDDIDAELNAFVERFDAFPQLIIIDNLLDMAPTDGEELQSHKNLMLEFKTLRERTGAFVCVVHHNKEDSDPNYPAPRKSLQSKISQTPELILSIALDQDGPTPIFRASAVKQRSGAQSADAKKGFEMWADPSRTSFSWKESRGFFK
jgi:hypothetical protein